MNTAASASGSALIALIVVIFFLIGIASIIGVVERRKLQSTREVQADPVAATSPKKSPDISQSPLSTGVPQPAINEVSTHESEPSICPSCSKLLRLAACRREQSRDHIGRFVSVCVLHGMGGSNSMEHGRR